MTQKETAIVSRRKLSKVAEKTWDVVTLLFRIRNENFDGQIKRICVILIITLTLIPCIGDPTLKVIDCINDRQSCWWLWEPQTISALIYTVFLFCCLGVHFFTGKFMLCLILWSISNVLMTSFYTLASPTGIFEGQPITLAPAGPAIFLLFGNVWYYSIFLILSILSFVAACVKDMIFVSTETLHQFYVEDEFVKEQIFIIYLLIILQIVFNVLVVTYFAFGMMKTDKILDQLEVALEIYDFDDIPFYEAIKGKRKKFLTRFQCVVKEIVSNLKEMSTYVPQGVRTKQLGRSDASSNDDESSVGSRTSEISDLTEISDVSQAISRVSKAEEGDEQLLRNRDVVYCCVLILNSWTSIFGEAKDIPKIHATFVERAFRSAAACGGVVVDVSAKRAIISFNDVNNRPDAVNDALNCFSSLQTAAKGQKLGCVITCNNSPVGIIKSPLLSKFYHFDNSLDRLIHIARLHRNKLEAKDDNIPVIVNKKALNSIKYTYEAKQFDFLEWGNHESFSEGEKRTTSLFKLVGRKEIGSNDQEWIYQIGDQIQSENFDQFEGEESYVSQINFAWRKFREKDYETVSRVLVKLKEQDPFDADVDFLMGKVERKTKHET